MIFQRGERILLGARWAATLFTCAFTVVLAFLPARIIPLVSPHTPKLALYVGVASLLGAVGRSARPGGLEAGSEYLAVAFALYGIPDFRAWSIFFMAASSLVQILWLRRSYLLYRP